MLRAGVRPAASHGWTEWKQPTGLQINVSESIKITAAPQVLPEIGGHESMARTIEVLDRRKRVAVHTRSSARRKCATSVYEQTPNRTLERTRRPARNEGTTSISPRGSKAPQDLVPLFWLSRVKPADVPIRLLRAVPRRRHGASSGW
jgi:hypothetical protein